MKIVKNPFFVQNGKTVPHAQHVLPKSYFSGSNFSKSLDLSLILFKTGKRVRFPWKLDKTLFWGHAQEVLPKSYFWGWNFSKSLHLSQILFKKGRQCAFHENCTKLVTLAPLQKEKTVRFFRSCAACFGQFAFLSVKVLKIVILARNCPQNGKTVRFPWQLYKTLLSGHAQHVLAKSHFWALKFLKSSNWPQIVLKTGKQCAFHENCKKPFFRLMRSTFCPNRIFQGQTSQNR